MTEFLFLMIKATTLIII